ncbi:MAG: FHA domain-containing protein [Thermoanaerobaculales bacterium]|jgi:transcriptional regulator with AAA-type ATPase domain|nr:FHA domain-containing protein [Thermoanaerobaculales bacterium]
MAKFILVYTHPTEGEQRFDLAPGRSYRVGSRPDNDIVIDQKDVSRRHAVLRVHDGSFHITDLDSKNGTFINGARTAAESFGCGDMVHLSSARLVIVEVGTGSYPPSTQAVVLPPDESGVRRLEDTQKFRSEASMEDVVSLLETTAVAVRSGGVAEPLRWAVEHLGFDGAVVLYRDDQDNVAMVASAGDLGELARSSRTLAGLATERRAPGSGTRVRQVTEGAESLLVATIGSSHFLVVRYSAQPPAIGDLRSVIAAVDAVLGCGRVATAERGAGIHASATGTDPLGSLAGVSVAVAECRRMVAEAAREDRPVVVVGERGAGCSVAARGVHDLSALASRRWVVIDLDRLSPASIEHRLLVVGEVLAAADQAEGGTVVLDHVAEMPVALWHRLLGELADRSTEVPRVTLILNQAADGEGADRAAAVAEGGPVRVPSLRRRIEDLPILIDAFARRSAGPEAADRVAFSAAALRAMGGYSWPGNLVELRDEVGRAIAGAGAGRPVEVEHLSARLRGTTDAAAGGAPDLESLIGGGLAEAREGFEALMIRRVLGDCAGNQAEAARRLGLSRAGLFKKMRKLGL